MSAPVKIEFLTEYRAQLLDLQSRLQHEEQWPMPLVHEFAPGVYMRTIFMKAGSFVIGRTHKTEHFNIVHTGRARLMMGGEVSEIGPSMFVSGVDVKKVLMIHEDMTWSTVHAVSDDQLVLVDGVVDIEATVDKLEPLIVCDDAEELALINTELKELL